MQQNLTTEDIIEKIYYEMGMIRTLSKFTLFAMDRNNAIEISEAEKMGEDCLMTALEDIEKRYWQVCELIDRLENPGLYE